jgi:putative spermidine/putrescine transport system ATP-binding protein/mannopine transport system ATP-binding protein
MHEAIRSSHGESVEVRALTKAYGKVVALNGVSLAVEPGEFIALLGPSGSGKTTLLMTVAGFESPQSGSVVIGDREVTHVAPYRRNLGMVFQRYALFPHLTVEKNVAYPLRMRGVPHAERRAAVSAALEMVDLGAHGSRRVDQLSGGQQQRVALARALVYEPPVLLMDEPLGALDRMLREQMQLEIRRLHKQLRTTIIYVTHDQDEALVMADRIAIMRDAQIQQVGTPRDLYRRPGSTFVAGFLGKMNFIPGVITGPAPGGRLAVSVGDHRGVALPGSGDLRADGTAREVVVGVRPEDVCISTTGPGVPGVLTELIFAGAAVRALVDLGGVSVEAETGARAFGDTIRPGDHVAISWAEDAALAYRPTNETPTED